jgi:hypothetical protein
VIQRRTQTAAYWQQFNVSDPDIAYLGDLILEEGNPVALDVLAKTLMERHCRQEEHLIAAELSKGPAYQPKDHYEDGQQIIFPAFDYTLGMVVGTRPGRNPEYGDFTVIQVQLEGEEDLREFASGLQGEHGLNRPEGDEKILGTAELRAAIDLYESYGDEVEEKLAAALEARPEFIHFRGQWFLKDLLAEISTGHLHLAEALIEIRGMPLPTPEFLSDLDLPAEISEEIQILSLNHALDLDERFDNVGDGGRDFWYLRRLTPREVVEPPPQLRIEVEPYDRQAMDQELLLIEREIDDEGSGEEIMGASRPLYRTSITLIYPHWRSGTLPLTVRTRGLFPSAITHHTPIVLIDGQSGDKMQGWVIHKAGFVHGLEDWYQRHKLPVGAFIKLERTRDPRVIMVDYEPRRLKHLWVKTASVKEGKLEFHMVKTPISCEFDEEITISEADANAVDALREAVVASGEGLLDIMMRIMPELIQLSPQGTVHAKAIYSAVNILKRTPPGPVFTFLSTEPCFVRMGGGYWTFDPALVRS